MKNLKNLPILLLLVLFSMSCTKSETPTQSDCIECVHIISPSETAGSVPVNLHGVHNLTLQYSQNGYAFANGTKGKFTISATELKVEIEGQECITLKNPTASTNQLEFTFKDSCRDNFNYFVSVANNGGLNEVNVGAIGGAFYGQFH